MKIIQITDLHIGLEGEDTYGIDVRKNFLDILNVAKNGAPDLLVLTGDLCYRDGDRSIYEWIKTQLDTCQLPYEIISGNHDDTRMMAEAFGMEDRLLGSELCYSRMLGDRKLLFMDSAVGLLSESQLNWLQRQLVQLEDVLLFIHHPPLFGGVPFMDMNHALREPNALRHILFAHSHPITIFCGHYHVDKTIFKKNVCVQITPSLFFQIGQRLETFEVDHRRIGWREIVTEGEQVRTSVFYLDGNMV